MDNLYPLAVTEFAAYFFGTTLSLVAIVFLFRLVKWSKKMTKGAFLFLAIFPMISIFPIIGQEIKKIEDIKKQQVKQEDEDSEPSKRDRLN